MKYIIITTATDDIEEARSISKSLVENKLAATVHISKIESFYTWKKKVENEEEYLLSIKTKKSLFKDIETYIKENHHYDLPEIVMIPINKTSKEFCNWINENTII